VFVVVIPRDAEPVKNRSAPAPGNRSAPAPAPTPIIYISLVGYVGKVYHVDYPYVVFIV
jgi:hypothetical protein